MLALRDMSTIDQIIDMYYLQTDNNDHSFLISGLIFRDEFIFEKKVFFVPGSYKNIPFRGSKKKDFFAPKELKNLKKSFSSLKG